MYFFSFITEGGSLILFDKSKTKFRKDGINWKKKKGGKGIQENHEKLKIGGIRVIKCCYTHSAGKWSITS